MIRDAKPFLSTARQAPGEIDAVRGRDIVCDPLFARPGADRAGGRHLRLCRAALLGSGRLASYLQSGDAAAALDRAGVDCRDAHRPHSAGGPFDHAGARGAGNSGIAAALAVPTSAFVFIALAGALALSSPAGAQTQISSVCGVTGTATAPASITYDPFSPTGLSEVTVPLVLRRNRGVILGRTNEVSLILTAPSGAPPLDITYQGYRVLYPEGSTAGRPRSLTSKDNGAGAAGEIRYDFGNLFASDLSTALNLRVTVPPGTDLSAGEPILLDMLYICSGEGGMQSVSVPTRETGAVRINVNTVSALQAYYAGSALDFGEIGDATTATVLAAPDRYTTSAANTLRVRSSGPFEVPRSVAK